MRAAPFILLAPLLLAGCMQLAPKHERPAAPVAASFPNADTSAAGLAAADLPWRDFFADPALRELIERALAHNRDLRVALLNIDAVRAQYELRRADELPTVGVGANASRVTSGGGKLSNTYTAGLSVAAYEIDLFGRVRSLGDSAAALVLASEEARRTVQVSLMASVANQVLALAADDELLELTQRTLATRIESLKLTQLKVDHGAAADPELRQAQSLVEAARATLAQQRRQRELDLNALALLVGQPLPEWPFDAGRLRRTTLPEVAAGLPSEALLRRPDVRQAEQGLVAANANIGAARAAFWPRIILTGSAGLASVHLSDLFKGGAWSFAAQVLQPIFDGGRNQANLAAAQVHRDVAVAQYERAIQAAFRDVADALAGRATLGEQLRAVLAQADAEAARYRLAELRFNNGLSSSLDLLDAQRSLFATQQAVVQTRLALLQNRVAVFRALAGGQG